MSKFQTKIIKEYEDKGYYVINLTRTNKQGIADLLCLKKDELPLFIECKEKNDTIKPLQRFRAKELIKKGFKSIFLKDNQYIYIMKLILILLMLSSCITRKEITDNYSKGGYPHHAGK